ncbi:MAG: lipid-A-disaccharide synthase [Phycisphaerae bacterium]|nr:lipid-A-disaccharide synthase [Phycisphaerae bacterium]
MSQQNQKTIFISALEHSAEMHCANLIRAVEVKLSANNPVWPGQNHIPSESLQSAIQWAGFGGEQMQQLGCGLLDNTVKRAAMIYNVLGQLGYYRKLIKQANIYFEQNQVDLVIVCDSPAFNFHIAKAAKKHGIPVLFYVAPQLWAWAPWRIYKLRRCCDKLACILPFEKDWFCGRGIDAEYVCNPLFDEMDINLAQNFKSYTNYDPTSPTIALLAGSRDAEIHSLWPAMLDIAAAIKQKHPDTVFTACTPDDEKRDMLKHIADEYAENTIPIDYEVNKLIDVAKRSDLALVASGSATLQVAAAGCPMVVMYQSNRWMWHLVGRWLIRTRFLSLVNILAGRELVPEFMPYFTDLEPIIKDAESLLCNPSKLTQTSQSLIELVRPLTERRACDVVAEMVLKRLSE